MKYKNYAKLWNFLPFMRQYVFIDTKDYLADHLFIQEKVRVKFGKEFINPEYPYLIIQCKIRKKDEESFLRALEKLKNKMCLMGFRDYEQFCTQVIPVLTPKTKVYQQ